MISTSAMANLTCKGVYSDNLLKINYLGSLSPTSIEAVPVHVEFIDSDVTKEFLGQYVNGAFSLSNSEYQNVQLTLAKSTNHGGRCGRCATDFSLELNAKLVLDQTLEFFTCTQTL